MANVKLTEKEVSTIPQVDLKVVITQTESGKERVRRMTPADMMGGTYYNKSEIDQMISDITYKAITLSAFSVAPPTKERGSTATSLTFSWAASKTPASVTITGGGYTASLDPAGSSHTLTVDLSSDTTFTITVTDERGATATRTATIHFYDSVYWGAAASWTGISGMSSAVSNTRARTITVNAGAGQYIWYVIPASYGTPTFTVGGFEGGFSLASTANVTNASGHTESYNIYRSDQANLGDTTVVIT